MNPSSSPETPPQGPLLEIRDLEKTFVSGGPFSQKKAVVAASGVTFEIRRGEAVALVGESGSGKSTLGRMILRLETPDRGEIRLDGRNVLETERRGAGLAYRKRVQMIFQDPFGSLNPVHDVAYHLERPLARHHRCPASERRDRVLELLKTVGMEPAADFVHRHPYELSGGQRQRVAIARALAVGPDLLVADEPTSMLDVSIRMGILELLAGLKDQGLAILLITHDLASARHLAERILVLYRGRIVEEGPSALVVEQPAHPYTRALVDAIAETGPMTRQTKPASGKWTHPTFAGCPFIDRCSEARDVCDQVDPAPRLTEGRRVRCHLYPDTNLEPASSLAGPTES